MPIVTFEMLYSEVQEVKKLLTRVLANEATMSVEEVSLAKVAKMLGKGERTIKRWVEQDGFPAREVSNGKSKTGKTYVFRLQDILEYQQRNKFKPTLHLTEIKKGDGETLEVQEKISAMEEFKRMQRKRASVHRSKVK